MTGRGFAAATFQDQKTSRSSQRSLYGFGGWTRTRYGTAGCPAPRIRADDIDQAVLQALYDFYTTSETVLTAMIDRAQAQRANTSTDRQDELAAIATQITTTEAAISKYHTAFENGAMDDATAGPRIRDLRQQLARLQAHHAQLADEAVIQPAPPPPGTIARIRAYLSQIMTSGTATERKAAIETLIHEVQLTDQGVIPVFKIPNDQTPLPDESGQTEEGSPVRTMVRSVGRQGLEP